jgi:hypothetical protein
MELASEGAHGGAEATPERRGASRAATAMPFVARAVAPETRYELLFDLLPGYASEASVEATMPGAVFARR